MLKRFFIGFIFYCLTFSASAQDTTSFIFLHVHKGDNVYVQNPLYKDSTFCTCEVKINNVLVPQLVKPNISAYEIDLSAYSMQDKLYIQIVHYKTCKPKVLNPRLCNFGPPVFKEVSISGDTLI